MTEKTKNRGALPDMLLSRPIGSPESRAAARSLLSDAAKPPYFEVVFVKPGRRDEHNCLIEPPVECDSRRASIGLNGGKTIERAEGESLADFKARVSEDLPAMGGGLTIFWNDDPFPNMVIVPDVY
jgi:hypothetical protein